ncbi:MAG: cytochrome c [Actinobacteria bacterium]|nr:cytochrome c [Actinomycetota bacterium]
MLQTCWTNTICGLVAVVLWVGVLSVGTGEALAADGAAVYVARCSACHGGEGEGRGSFPALADNPFLDDEAAVAALIRGGAGAMPAFPQLSNEDVAALTAYLTATWGTAQSPGSGESTTTSAGGGTTGTTTPDGQETEAEPLKPGDPLNGEALFVGSKGFKSGAPPCLACHSAGANGGAGGGLLLGTDLTDLAERAGGTAGISGMLAAPGFPVMLAAYEGKPLSEQERADLGAYFEDLAASDAGSGSVLAGKLWLLGAAGAAVLFGLMGLFWPRHRVTAAERLRGGAR